MDAPPSASTHNEPKKKKQVLFNLLLVVVPFVLFLVLVASSGHKSEPNPKTVTPPAPTPVPEKTQLPADIVKSLHIGMEQAQVLGVVGNPQVTSNDVNKKQNQSHPTTGHFGWFYGVEGDKTLMLGFYKNSLQSILLIDADNKVLFEKNGPDADK